MSRAFTTRAAARVGHDLSAVVAWLIGVEKPHRRLTVADYGDSHQLLWLSARGG